MEIIIRISFYVQVDTDICHEWICSSIDLLSSNGVVKIYVAIDV
jgi:hypothetical protein